MRIRYVAAVGAVLLGVAACDASAPAQKPVTGARDDVKQKAAVKERSHKEKTSERKCTRKVNGRCKSYRTVVGWKKVVDVRAKPALYCVELDDVNGSTKDDDVWYTVRSTTYWSAAGKPEGSAVKFTPIHGGCW